ncbi:MAG: pyridoxal phosphate-dependent aminotransferase [Lachnospiraceae bacterium]|nr:pyridoxal phosphate-dependent aminotransferase [Lachnospiraceae bacterium]
MINSMILDLNRNGSAIRAMFEEGAKMAKEFGRENVYDYSLGNPSVVPPQEIRDTLLDIVANEDENVLHGYMNNAGFEDVRTAVADHLNAMYGTAFTSRNILMTVGAAGGLNVILKTLLNPGDEVITFAPFFGEYRNYVRNYGGVLVTAATDPETFLPVPAVLAEAITPRTKALIINTPNNPTGVVYPESLIIEIAKVLEEKQREFGTSVYLISDEPYRELVYDGVTVPYLTKYYRNTVVGYSYSKSLSLPGERIGYLVLPDELTDADEIIPGAAAANRILGFVNAPSLIQKTVGRCLDAKVDVEIYNRNRELLYGKLTEYGFSCIKPQGAFYLFVKAPDGDDKAFVAAAKKHRILMVAGTGFGGPGYVRLAYCVSYDMIERSLPGFAALAQEYGLR